MHPGYTVRLQQRVVQSHLASRVPPPFPLSFPSQNHAVARARESCMRNKLRREGSRGGRSLPNDKTLTKNYGPFRRATINVLDDWRDLRSACVIARSRSFDEIARGR